MLWILMCVKIHISSGLLIFHCLFVCYIVPSQLIFITHSDMMRERTSQLATVFKRQTETQLNLLMLL